MTVRNEHPSPHQEPRTPEPGVTRRNALAGAALTGVALAVGATAAAQTPARQADQIEPDAGRWHTWLLGSSAEVRSPPPPDRAASAAELGELRAMAALRTAGHARIVHWDVGGPSYRWNEIVVGELLGRGVPTQLATRHMALLNAAIYDAVIAAWAGKYAHNRPRPAVADAALGAALPIPASPSYPSATAAAAGAAAAVLSYVLPERARAFADMADEAAESRMVAGLNYRSDITAGLAIGRAVAARAVERGRGDRSDAVWTGSVPVGPGRWQGTNPVLPMAGTWRTWALARPDEFRPPEPPAYDSAQKAAELAELRAVQRTPAMTSAAWFWEMAAGGARGFAYWNELIRRKLFEHRLDGNPPQAARAFALPTIAYLDACVACWDAKFTYWAIRPPQLDPNLRPLFPPPNHPSYPAAHGALSTAASTALAHVFPADAAVFEALAAEAAEARIWAGIHYRSDIVAGRALGRKVAERAIAVALGEARQP